MSNQYKFNVKYKSFRKEVEEQVKKAERKGLGYVGMFIRGEVKERTPVITGLLKSKWAYRTTKNEKVTIGNPLKYAPVVEFGKKKGNYKGRYMLRDSIMENVDRIKQVFIKGFNEVLK